MNKSSQCPLPGAETILGRQIENPTTAPGTSEIRISFKTPIENVLKSQVIDELVKWSFEVIGG